MSASLEQINQDVAKAAKSAKSAKTWSILNFVVLIIIVLGVYFFLSYIRKSISVLNGQTKETFLNWRQILNALTWQPSNDPNSSTTVTPTPRPATAGTSKQN